MGFHADVQNGIVALLEAALPDRIPVFNLLAVSERELNRTASSVSLMREMIDYEPHPEINPDPSVLDQGAEWTWVIYVVGGAGNARANDKGADVDLILETVQTALNAQRPTTPDCGPMHLISEDFEEMASTSVAYVQRWRHRRLA